MRRYSMSERIAWAKLRPRRASEWHQVQVICGYLALIAVFITVIFFFKSRHRADMEQNWQSAIATIEDVQPKLVAQVNTARGGAMLYESVILAKYSADGAVQKRWITVEQQPESLGDVQLQAFRWKGKQCVVRWRPSDRSQVIAEIS
jgi:hypothetical protein